MRVGVTGAFGFLGATVVARLLERGAGEEIVAFSSRTSANPVFDPARVCREPLDVLDARDVLAKTAGLDALFHFAGKVSYARREKRATWDANVLGSRNVFQAVVANRIPRLLYASSINVLGAPEAGRRSADETGSPWRPGSRHPTGFRSAADALEAVEASAAGDYRFLRRVRLAYFDSKLAAFELARQWHATRGLPVVSVLPGTVVGAGDVHYAISGLVDRVFRNRLALTLPGATSFVDAVDFGRGVLLAWERGRIGESYVLSGRDEDNLSYREFMRLAAEVGRSFGRKTRRDFLVAPAWLAAAVAGVAETFAPSASLTSALVRSGSEGHRFSSAKACRELGWRHERTLADGIADCWRSLCETRGYPPNVSRK